MKKLSKSECNSKNVFTQDNCYTLIDEMEEDLDVLVEEYSQDLPKEFVLHELLRSLTFQVYSQHSSHKEAFNLLSNAFEEGMVLHKEAESSVK